MKTLDQDEVRRALAATARDITDERIETPRGAAAGCLAYDALAERVRPELRRLAEVVQRGTV